MIKKRLIQLLSKEKKYIVYQIIWQWAALLGNMAAMAAIGFLIEKAVKKEAEGALFLQTAVLLAAVLLLRFVCDKMASKASYQASRNVKQIIRGRLYEKLLRLGPSYKEKIASSEIVQVSTEGVEQLEIYFGKYLPQLFYSLLAPVTLFAVLAFIDWKPCLVLLIFVPLIPLSIVMVQKFAKRLLNKYWGIYTELGDSFLENLQGLTTLKIYQADSEKARQMDAESEKFRKITMKVLTMQLNSTSIMDIMAYGGAAVGMVITVSDFLNGRVGLAGAFTIIMLSAEFFLPLRLLGSYFHIAMNGMAASDKIFRILDLEEPKEGTQKIEKGRKDLEISFSHVNFSYEKEREILHDISLTIRPGTLVSLAGTSGCGKSTIAGLLTGRNRGYEGSITIGGKELSDLSTENLLSCVTLVRHDSYLFKGTVEETLRMGKSDASEKEMEEVLRKVNLWDFLSSQEGLQTMLQEKASNLSGGQKQRLCLARALLHDTPVYIFDEATSNIDVESEEMIMEVIHELARTKTVLVISHRLANVVASSCIFMMKDGKITERGSHGELLERAGDYARMYRGQMELEKYRNIPLTGKEEKP